MVGGDIDPVIPSKGVGFHAYFLLLFFVFPFRLTICVHVCVRVCVVWSLFKNSFGRGINRTARRRRRRKVGGSSSPAFMMKMQLPFRSLLNTTHYQNAERAHVAFVVFVMVYGQYC